MVTNGFFALSIFSLASAMSLPSFSFRFRLFIFIFSLLVSLLLYGFFRIKGTKPPFLSWISSTTSPNWAFLFAFVFASFALSYSFLLPKTGILVSLVSPNGDQKQIKLDLPAFEVAPDIFPWGFIDNDKDILVYSAAFEVKSTIHSLLLFASYGEVEWELDHFPIAHIDEVSNSRYHLLVQEIPPGFHFLTCKSFRSMPPPQISVTTGTKEPISGPFWGTNPAFSLIAYDKRIPIFFFLLTFFFLIPFLNKMLVKMASFSQRNCYLLIPVGFCLSLLLFISIRALFYQNTSRYYEADEAAFGIMSERLLLGQSPPLFHYGQNYQGTLESIPLSLLLNIFGVSAAGLHWLPILWGICFLVVTTFTFGKYGNSSLSLFVFLILGLGGLHFHWILSKTWFGYSFSLFSGSILWWIALHGLKKGRLSPIFSIIWGVFAGIGFYQLPLSFPFIIGSGCILLKLFFSAFWSINNLTGKKLFSALHRSGTLLSIVFLFAASVPFWMSPLLSRQIAPPRVLNENPLIDRFLGECLPVLLGVRSPYDHFSDLSSTFFPVFPPLFFLLSLLLFPFISKRAFAGYSFLEKQSFRLSLFVFSAATVLIVTYSPFGIWPWYAVPLYWSMPILYFAFLQFLWRLCPAFSFAALALYLLSLSTSFLDYNPIYHQPSSLSLQGFWLPTDFSNVKSLIAQKNIRYLLCDQGFDMMYENTGRDWIGECLLFDFEENTLTVDRNSRRAPDSAQELLNASRVGYLFHKNFFFNDLSARNDLTNNSAIFLKTLDTLFGPEYLNFERFEFDPYILFLPSDKNPGFDKSLWSLTSSNPLYLGASSDHNLGLRGIGRESYWSSDRIPQNGCFYKAKFEKSKEIQNILLFHGTKFADRTKENTVYLTLDNGLRYEAGSLSYVPEIRCSHLKLYNSVNVKEIEIQVVPPPDESWWTIYEVWVY